MNHKEKYSRVDLKRSAWEPHTKGKVVKDPSLREPVCHDRVHAKRSRDRSALEVLALARGVLGQHSDRHVEAGKADKARQNEERERDGVGNGAESNREGDHGGGNTERNLHHFALAY